MELARTVAIYGSTGSIGTQALDVIRSERHRLRPTVLVASDSVELLASQAVEFKPDAVGIVNSKRARELRSLVDSSIEIAVGDEIFDLVDRAEVVLNGVVGFAGLRVTLAAVSKHRVLALANKESLIAAGEIVNLALSESTAQILPVDSEHSAIFQCLEGRNWLPAETRLILTASGGPFLSSTSDELDNANLEMALNHPTWSMGPKITVDSSTLVNKGLEVIEAHFLFDVDYTAIDVVIHPQSIVHSMVEFSDGSTIAQLSKPDMRLAISRALLYPDRAKAPYGAMGWPTETKLEFFRPDLGNFPALGLAIDAGIVGGGAPCWFNAANEVVVSHFLLGEFSWRTISNLLGISMERYDGSKPTSIEEVYYLDESARRVTEAVVRGFV